MQLSHFEKLHLLSLAVEQALSREDLAEVQALLSQRELYIEQIEREGLTLSDEELAIVTEVDQRIVRTMRRRQGELADDLRSQVNSPKAARAYKLAA